MDGYAAVLQGAMDRLMEHIYIARRLVWDDVYASMEPVFQKEGYRQPGGPVRSVLVSASLHALGDNVLLSAFLRELRRSLPSSYIVLLVKPYTYPQMELCPYVNRVLCLKTRFRQNVLGFLSCLKEICRELWPLHIDAAFVSHWGDDRTETRLAAYFSGARERYGFSDGCLRVYQPGAPGPSEMEQLFLTKPVVSPPEIVHELPRMLYLLTAAGLNWQDDRAEVWLSTADILTAQGLLSALPSGHPCLAVSIGAGESKRRYPPAMYAVALRELAAEGFVFVILGGDQDKPEAENLVDSLPQGSFVNLAGRTSLREMAAVVSISDIFLGNDTGTVHVASALHKPVVVVMGEAVSRSRPEYYPAIYSPYTRFHPWQTDSICLRPAEPLGDCTEKVAYGWCAHKEPHCIKQIRPQDIAAAVRELWEKKHN